MFTWIHIKDWFKKKNICLEQKSWNDFYFSAESPIHNEKIFYACARAKKVMSPRHSACIPSSVKLPLFKLNITFYFKCYPFTIIYLLIFTSFAVDLKLLIYTKKSLYSLYSNNIELIDDYSVTEQEMQSFPKEFLKSMWTSWETHTHLFTHWSKKHSKERLHSCAVSFLVFTV